MLEFPRKCPQTLDQSPKLAKNQSILTIILHGLPLLLRRIVIFRRHVILGACFTCLLQTGAIFCAPTKAAGKEAPSSVPSGRDLLFSNSRNQPVIDPSAPVAVPAPAPVFTPVESSVAVPIKVDAVKSIPAPVVNNSPENSPPEDVAGEGPVDLTADMVEYDEIAGIVSATGNVELLQAGRILRAEKVSYSLNEDKVQATGDVVLNEVTGDTYFADSVELKDKMKDGFVRGLHGVLADGSRFTAEEAEKVADLKIIMRKGSYTACEPCKADPSRAPLWAIKANRVTHHKDEQRVSYEATTFEVAGVPVAYTPYFSHPDGSVKRKSGFLTPRVGFDSDLGGIYQQQYYWDIAPEKDLTVGLMAMTEEAPLLLTEYRQRFENAEIKVSGGGTYSGRTDRTAGNDVEREKKERGHLFVDGLWDINDKWRAGTAIQLVSDEQYLNQYDLSNEDVLENKLYVERFSDRDYATARLIRFKDIRVNDRVEDQPNVLPEIYSQFLGAPNSLLGGRWSVGASALGLQREGDEQDLARASLEAGWQGRHVGNIGLVNTLDLTMRGDAYRVNDRALTSAGDNRDESTLRAFTRAHLKTSLPFEREFEATQMVLEPLVAMTVGSHLNQSNDDVPNEDSQDVFLDAVNIFSPNRFPGYDRIEDEVHATYGVRTGLYADNGYQGEVFFGQSYRFDKEGNPFPKGSGLSEQKSDFVGNISARMGEKFQLNYGMQLANDNFASQRHEIDARGKIGRLSLGTRYFYANALQGTGLDESREQIRNDARYQILDDWAVFGTTQYDLARETEGLRKLSYGLDYQGQCVNFLVTGQRTLTRDSTGDSGTKIMMRLGLKNLGEFQTSGFTLGADK